MTTRPKKRATTGERIAAILFTNIGGHEVDRLVQFSKANNLGAGWCKQAIIDVIEE